MNPAAWCIKNNRTATMLFILLALAGLQTFRTMPRLENPDFTIRTAVVATYFPGAAPQKVEELITDKLEKKIQEMAEVKTLASQSLSGLSLIEVEVQARYYNLQPIWEKLRNKLDDIRPSLPEGVYGPYVNDEFGDVFPVVLALTGDGYSYRELKDAADDIRDALLRVPQVAKVVFYGTQDERIFIEFSNARLADLGLTPLQLADLLKAQNVLRPGGNAQVGPERVIIEATGEFKSLDQIKRVSLRISGRSECIYLEDVAAIERHFVDPPTTLTSYNGRPAIMLAVSMAADGKVTEFGRRIRDGLDHLRADWPVGLECEPFLYQPKFVERAIGDFTGNLEEAFFFVVVVMFFLCGWRTGLIVGTLVPLAMLLCIALMPLCHIKLHSVSIASLIIALGMLVDNGIVTSENILVRLSNGEERGSACAAAVRELWLPLLTSSLTTIVAFLPIALAQSDVGEYCLALFQVITLTLLGSWVLSLTFTPMLCYYFLKPAARRTAYDTRPYAVYRALLLWGLRRRWAFLGLLVLLFAASIWGFRCVPTIFFPPNEREMLLIDFWQPYGTDIRTTRDQAARLESFLLADTNVAAVGAFIGDGGPRWYLALNIEQENPNYANLIVNTKTVAGVAPLIQKLKAHLAAEYPDARFTVKQLENGPPVGAPIQIRIAGKDPAVIYRLRDRIQNALKTVPGVVNIRDNWGEWTKKLVVEVNQEQAKLAGFTSQDVALSLQSQISGMEATEFREGKEIIPIVMRSRNAYRENIGKIESLNVYSYATSKSLPLLQIARTRLTWQPSNIRRRNTVRTMTVMTDVQGRFASEVLADAIPKLDALRGSADWPTGYRVEYAGEDADSQEAQNSMLAGLPLAIGLLLLILVWQFNSIRRPLIIALTVPPMMVGITAGLLITNAPYGFMAFLGLISLMGVIVNNAIMMIDRIEIERAAGQNLQDAIVVSAQRRLRPILATAITTIVGLIPLSLQGGEMWRPMANTIMFGLAFATLLTLVQCPVLYALFFRASFENYAWNPAALKKSSDE